MPRAVLYRRPGKPSALAPLLKHYFMAGELDRRLVGNALDVFRRGERLRLWRQHRAELLAEFVEEHPGRRPWAWWAFDAPGLRRIVGGGPCSAGNAAGCSWGLPLVLDADPRRPPLVESEAAYLKRLRLLLPGELRRIKASELEAQALELDGGNEAA